MEEEAVAVSPQAGTVRVVLRSGDTMEPIGVVVSSFSELRKTVKRVTGGKDLVIAQENGGGLVEIEGEEEMEGEGEKLEEGMEFFLFPRKVWDARELVYDEGRSGEEKRMAASMSGGDGGDFLRQMQWAINASKAENSDAVASRERLRKRAAIYDLAENPAIDATGDCQFDAVADQLRRRAGVNDATKESVRAAAVRWIEENAETDLGHGMTVKQWVQQTNNGKGFAQYVSEMRRGNCWGDETTLLAIVNVYDVKLMVISSTEGELGWWRAHGQGEKELFLGYELDKHYWSLIGGGAEHLYDEKINKKSGGNIMDMTRANFITRVNERTLRRAGYTQWKTEEWKGDEKSIDFLVNHCHKNSSRDRNYWEEEIMVLDVILQETKGESFERLKMACLSMLGHHGMETVPRDWLKEHTQIDGLWALLKDDMRSGVVRQGACRALSAIGVDGISVDDFWNVLENCKRSQELCVEMFYVYRDQFIEKRKVVSSISKLINLSLEKGVHYRVEESSRGCLKSIFSSLPEEARKSGMFLWDFLEKHLKLAMEQSHRTSGIASGDLVKEAVPKMTEKEFLDFLGNLLTFASGEERRDRFFCQDLLRLRLHQKRSEDFSNQLFDVCKKFWDFKNPFAHDWCEEIALVSQDRRESWTQWTMEANFNTQFVSEYSLLQLAGTDMIVVRQSRGGMGLEKYSSRTEIYRSVWRWRQDRRLVLWNHAQCLAVNEEGLVCTEVPDFVRKGQEWILEVNGSLKSTSGYLSMHSDSKLVISKERTTQFQMTFPGNWRFHFIGCNTILLEFLKSSDAVEDFKNSFLEESGSPQFLDWKVDGSTVLLEVGAAIVDWEEWRAKEQMARVFDELVVFIEGQGSGQPNCKMKCLLHPSEKIENTAPTRKPDNEEYDCNLKFLMIGDANVGKAQMVSKFADDPLDPWSNRTMIGVDFKERTMNVQDKTVKLQVWDIAGQERLKTIPLLYYRGAEGILLVYDVTDESSFRSIRTWKHDFENHGTQSTNLILVGNRCEKVDERVIDEEMGKELAEEYGIPFIEVSYETGFNVEKAFATLADLVCQRIFLKNEKYVLDERMYGKWERQQNSALGDTSLGLQRKIISKDNKLTTMWKSFPLDWTKGVVVTYRAVGPCMIEAGSDVNLSQWRFNPGDGLLYERYRSKEKEDWTKEHPLKCVSNMSLKNQELHREADSRKLWRAMQDNTVALARELLQKRDVDLEFILPDDDGTPLLVEALNQGRVRIARLLVEAGALLNYGNDGSVHQKFLQKTPLLMAIVAEICSSDIRGSKEDVVAAEGLVELLIKHGADCNPTNAYMTPLAKCLYCRADHRDVEHPRFRVVFEQLTSHGASPKNLEKDYLPLFHRAHNFTTSSWKPTQEEISSAVTKFMQRDAWKQDCERLVKFTDAKFKDGYGREKWDILIEEEPRKIVKYFLRYVVLCGLTEAEVFSDFSSKIGYFQVEGSCPRSGSFMAHPPIDMETAAAKIAFELGLPVACLSLNADFPLRSESLVSVKLHLAEVRNWFLNQLRVKDEPRASFLGDQVPWSREMFTMTPEILLGGKWVLACEDNMIGMARAFVRSLSSVFVISERNFGGSHWDVILKSVKDCFDEESDVWKVEAVTNALIEDDSGVTFVVDWESDATNGAALDLAANLPNSLVCMPRRESTLSGFNRAEFSWASMDLLKEKAEKIYKKLQAGVWKHQTLYVIGDSFAGKTMLLRRMLKPEGELGETRSTHPSVIEPILLKGKSGGSDWEPFGAETSRLSAIETVDPKGGTFDGYAVELPPFSYHHLKPLDGQEITHPLTRKDFISPNIGDNVVEQRSHDRPSLVSTRSQNESSPRRIDVAVDKAVEKNDILFNVWDFGGQHEYYNIHQLFLTDYAVCLLVADVTDQIWEKHLKFWAFAVCARKKRVRLIAVLTKVDKADSEMLKKKEDVLKAVLEEIRGELSGQDVVLEEKVFLTSSKEGERRKELAELKSHIYQLGLEQMTHLLAERKKVVKYEWWGPLLDRIVAHDGYQVMTWKQVRNMLPHGSSSDHDAVDALQFFHENKQLYFVNDKNPESRLVVTRLQFIVDLLGEVLRSSKEHHGSRKNKLVKDPTSAKEEMKPLLAMARGGLVSKELLLYVYGFDNSLEFERVELVEKDIDGNDKEPNETQRAKHFFGEKDAYKDAQIARLAMASLEGILLHSELAMRAIVSNPINHPGNRWFFIPSLLPSDWHPVRRSFSEWLEVRFDLLPLGQFYLVLVRFLKSLGGTVEIKCLGPREFEVTASPTSTYYFDERALVCFGMLEEHVGQLCQSLKSVGVDIQKILWRSVSGEERNWTSGATNSCSKGKEEASDVGDTLEMPEAEPLILLVLECLPHENRSLAPPLGDMADFPPLTFKVPITSLNLPELQRLDMDGTPIIEPVYLKLVCCIVGCLPIPLPEIMGDVTLRESSGMWWYGIGLLYELKDGRLVLAVDASEEIVTQMISMFVAERKALMEDSGGNMSFKNFNPGYLLVQESDVWEVQWNVLLRPCVYTRDFVVLGSSDVQAQLYKLEPPKGWEILANHPKQVDQALGGWFRIGRGDVAVAVLWMGVWIGHKSAACIAKTLSSLRLCGVVLFGWKAGGTSPQLSRFVPEEFRFGTQPRESETYEQVWIPRSARSVSCAPNNLKGYLVNPVVCSLRHSFVHTFKHPHKHGESHFQETPYECHPDAHRCFDKLYRRENFSALMVEVPISKMHLPLAFIGNAYYVLGYITHDLVHHIVSLPSMAKDDFERALHVQVRERAEKVGTEKEFAKNGKWAAADGEEIRSLGNGKSRFAQLKMSWLAYQYYVFNKARGSDYICDGARLLVYGCKADQMPGSLMGIRLDVLEESDGFRKDKREPTLYHAIDDDGYSLLVLQVPPGADLAKTYAQCYKAASELGRRDDVKVFWKIHPRALNGPEKFFTIEEENYLKSCNIEGSVVLLGSIEKMAVPLSYSKNWSSENLDPNLEKGFRIRVVRFQLQERQVLLLEVLTSYWGDLAYVLGQDLRRLKPVAILHVGAKVGVMHEERRVRRNVFVPVGFVLLAPNGGKLHEISSSALLPDDVPGFFFEFSHGSIPSPLDETHETVFFVSENKSLIQTYDCEGAYLARACEVKMDGVASVLFGGCYFGSDYLDKYGRQSDKGGLFRKSEDEECAEMEIFKKMGSYLRGQCERLLLEPLQKERLQPTSVLSSFAVKWFGLGLVFCAAYAVAQQSNIFFQ